MHQLKDLNVQSRLLTVYCVFFSILLFPLNNISDKSNQHLQDCSQLVQLVLLISAVISALISAVSIFFVRQCLAAKDLIEYNYSLVSDFTVFSEYRLRIVTGSLLRKRKTILLTSVISILLRLKRVFDWKELKQSMSKKIKIHWQS